MDETLFNAGDVIFLIFLAFAFGYLLGVPVIKDEDEYF